MMMIGFSGHHISGRRSTCNALGDKNARTSRPILIWIHKSGLDDKRSDIHTYHRIEARL